MNLLKHGSCLSVWIGLSFSDTCSVILQLTILISSNNYVIIYTHFHYLNLSKAVNSWHNDSRHSRQVTTYILQSAEFSLSFLFIKRKNTFYVPQLKHFHTSSQLSTVFLCKLVFNYLLSQCEYTWSLALTTDPIVTTTWEPPLTPPSLFWKYSMNVTTIRFCSDTLP